MAAVSKTRAQRREELKRVAAGPNGTDKLHAILTGKLIPCDKLPIGTLTIEAIINHKYPDESE